MRGTDRSRACPACRYALPEMAQFCPACGVSLEAARGAPAPEDELHQVTAMFPDVVGSTALGERLSPEEVKALIGECVSAMARAVEDHGGFVQAYQGDGICAIFGIPRAHEDDPERSAWAALRILEVVGAYARDVRSAWNISGFNVRIGINTGPAAVGTMGASDPQVSALGDTTNTAARLQGAAEPGTIVIGEATAKRLSERFVLEPVGPFILKGKTEPVKAFKLLRTQPLAEPGQPLVPLVGREAELASMRRSMEACLVGRGQVLSLVGEAGIGKSRLLRELRSIAGDQATWLQGRCPSYGGELTYWPFVEILRSWLGVAEGEAEVAVRLRLRAKIASLLQERTSEVLPYLGRLLSVMLDSESEEQVRYLSPEALAERVHKAYAIFVESLAGARPLVVAIEDLHWADPSTRALAESLLESVERAALLLTVTYRDDPEAEAWRFRLKVAADYPRLANDISIGPLAHDESAAMAEALVTGEIDGASKAAILARAEGNPLYLEQILRSLVESGRFTERRVLSIDQVDVTGLPPALEGLLVARIDRLPRGARRLAQFAAVAGRSFLRRVIERIAEDADFELDVGELLRTDLIRVHRRFPELEYIFTHGLIQEAAASTLTAARRREVHGKVASAFEELLAAGIEDYLEIVAYHYAESNNRAKALEYLQRAAEKAASVYANEQAIRLWDRAAGVARALADTASFRRINERLAGVRLVTGDFDEGIRLYRQLADEARDADEAARLLASAALGVLGAGELERGVELSDEAFKQNPTDPEVRARVLITRASAAKSQGRYEDGRAFLEALEELGEAELSIDLAEKRARGWMGYFAQVGEVKQAATFATRALELAEKLGDPMRVLWARSGLAVMKVMTGELPVAKLMLRDCYEDARAMGDLATVMEAGSNLIEVQVMLGDLLEAEALALELTPTVTTPMWRAVALQNLGLSRFEQGRWKEARADFREVLEISRAAGTPQFTLTPHIYLAAIDVLNGSGDPGSALREALVEARAIEGDAFHSILAHRWLAELSLRQGDPQQADKMAGSVLAQAEREDPPLAVPVLRLLGTARNSLARGSGGDALEKALQLARSMGMQVEEGRTLTAMARSDAGQDRVEIARRVREIFERCGALRDLAELDAVPF